MKNENRTKKINVRLTPEEYEQLSEYKNQSGLSLSDIVRQTAARIEIVARQSTLTAEALAELSRIGNNVNQLAHVANKTGSIHIPSLNQIASDLRNIAEGVRS